MANETPSARLDDRTDRDDFYSYSCPNCNYSKCNGGDCACECHDDAEPEATVRA